MWRSVRAIVLSRCRHYVLPKRWCYHTARYYTPESRSVCLAFFVCFFCGFSFWRTVMEGTWVRELRSRSRPVWRTCFRRCRKCSDTQPLCAVRRVIGYVWFRWPAHSPVFATSDVTGLFVCSADHELALPVFSATGSRRLYHVMYRASATCFSCQCIVLLLRMPHSHVPYELPITHKL